ESDFMKAFNSNDKPQYAAGLDQFCPLFAGWWVVSNWSSNSDNRDLAQKQMLRVLSRLMKHRYLVFQPDGKAVPESRGGNAQFAGGFLKHFAEEISFPGTGWPPIEVIPSQDVPGFKDIPSNEWWKPFRDYMNFNWDIIKQLLNISFPDEIPAFRDDDLH